jgi:hypothetical protein
MTDSNDPFDHINCRTVLLKLTGIGNLARWVCTLVSISFSKFFFGLVFCVRWLIHVFGFGFFFFQIFYFLKNAQESFFFFGLNFIVEKELKFNVEIFKYFG